MTGAALCVNRLRRLSAGTAEGKEVGTVGAPEEVNGEDGDERFEGVAHAGFCDDQVVNDGEDGEGSGEESCGGNAAAKRDGRGPEIH